MGRNPQACLFGKPFEPHSGMDCLSLSSIIVRIQCIQQEKGAGNVYDDDANRRCRRCGGSEVCEGKTISDFIRDAVFEKIETQDDLAALRAAVEEDDGTRYTHAQVLAELGL